LVFATAVADAEALLLETGHEVVFPRQQIGCVNVSAGHQRSERPSWSSGKTGLSSDSLPASKDTKSAVSSAFGS